MKFQTNMISRLPPDDLDHAPRRHAAQLSFARSQFPRPRTLPWWFRSIHRGPVPYHSIPCHTIPYLDMPCHTIPYRTIPICNLLQTMPCHAISRYTSPYIAMPCRAMPCLCHALPTCWKSASISSLSLTSGRSPPGATFLNLYHADPGTKGGSAWAAYIYISPFQYPQRLDSMPEVGCRAFVYQMFQHATEYLVGLAQARSTTVPIFRIHEKRPLASIWHSLLILRSCVNVGSVHLLQSYRRA